MSTALYAFAAFAAFVVEGDWPKYIEGWRYVRMINHLSDHYVIRGYGEIATSSDNVELSIEEIHIGNSSALAGRPLSDVMHRDKMTVVVVGIQHAQGAVEFNPAAGTVLNGGDHPIALGSSQVLKELERAAR